MLLELGVTLLLSIFAYLIFPICYRYSNGKVNEKKGKKLALWNSIICEVIFTTIGFAVGVEPSTKGSMFAQGFFYYFIAKRIMIDYSLTNESNENLKDETENEETVFKCKHCGMQLFDDEEKCSNCQNDNPYYIIPTNDNPEISLLDTENLAETESNILIDNENHKTQKKQFDKKKLGIVIICSILALILVVVIICASLQDGNQIIFNSCGGSHCASITTQGNEVINLPVPTREDCIFDGWYSEKNGKGVQIKSTSYQNKLIDSNIEVYASWLKYNPKTFNTSSYSISQTSSNYYWGIETTSNYNSVLKSTTIWVTLNVGYFLVNEGTRVDSISNINISAQVAGHYVHFNNKGSTSITVSKQYSPWDTISITNVSASFTFLEQIVE